ncbi:IscA/HesB family protein [Desulfocurvus sp.]|jgi:Fe-S cluster assembly iron-binding protein IscA|uniref:IscA/HesB family protein n=1 Tax=Desulfocurvus sp. TaxID=2871698 RepID=UPI0025C4D665|nr:IscA/HesB family protein [Desulfocurvus sp.]MCK9241000.1 IscA/HesB family protein [Desulfocurvus sp.]
MLELTDAARTELLNYFKDKTPEPVRVFLAPGGCSGPRLSLALDQKRDDDAIFDFEGGLTFVMNQALLDEAKPVKVDVTYTGFTVESSLQMAAGGCGCSSASSCGSAGSGGCGCC